MQYHIDFLWNTLRYQQTRFSIVDQKAGFGIALEAALLAVLAVMTEKLALFDTWFGISIFMAVSVLTGIVVLLLLQAIRPAKLLLGLKLPDAPQLGGSGDTILNLAKATNGVQYGVPESRNWLCQFPTSRTQQGSKAKPRFRESLSTTQAAQTRSRTASRQTKAFQLGCLRTNRTYLFHSWFPLLVLRTVYKKRVSRVISVRGQMSYGSAGVRLRRRIFPLRVLSFIEAIFNHAAVREHTRTGWPFSDKSFVTSIEDVLNCRLRNRKPGPRLER